MNCKECKGKGFYQPLIGPSEPCQVCQESGTWRDVLYPIDQFSVAEPYAPISQLNRVVAYLLTRDTIEGYIRIDVNGRVLQGAAAIRALRTMKSKHPDHYKKLVPDGVILASMSLKVAQKACIAQRSGNAHIKSLNRTLMNLTTSVNSVGKVLKTKIPADWSMEQKRAWTNLITNFNTLEYTILQMSDGKDEL